MRTKDTLRARNRQLKRAPYIGGLTGALSAAIRDDALTTRCYVRKILALSLFLGSSGFLFSVEISAGVDLSYSPLLYTEKVTSLNFSSGGGGEANTVDISSTIQTLGLGVFVDASFLRLGLGYKATVGGTTEDGVALTSSKYELRESWLAMRAFVEYTMYQGLFSLAMLAGIEYDLNLSLKDGGGKDLKPAMSADEAAGLDQLWAKGGVVADFAPSGGPLYFRPIALFGVKFNSKAEADKVQNYTSQGSTFSVKLNTYALDFGLLVGYKLAAF
jgi:hypothetical protein